MVEIDSTELFETDEYGRQRSVLFAIVIATGFLTVAAGASTLFATTNAIVGAGLLGLGVVLLGAAIAIATGMADDLLFDR